jgi:hypothetical protein
VSDYIFASVAACALGGVLFGRPKKLKLKIQIIILTTVFVTISVE